MSFSSTVKEELAQNLGNARHCQKAELNALIHFSANHAEKGTIGAFIFRSESLSTVKKFFTLCKKTYNIDADLSEGGKKGTYQAAVYGDEEFMKAVGPERSCCMRAYIRGAFLAAGSISDPEKSYHFEIVCTSQTQAAYLCDMIRQFEIGAKIVVRKGSYVVYVKEGSQIVDLLNVMGAHVALMNYENVRILKEMKNSVNRQVNCETANISKTISAAVKQIEDIRYIQNTIGFEGLNQPLKEMAEVRLANSEASLKELGEMMDPPVGKSGVNHRLHKLSMIADELRGKEESKL